jgi:hypothetical protein
LLHCREITQRAKNCLTQRTKISLVGDGTNKKTASRGGLSESDQVL